MNQRIQSKSTKCFLAFAIAILFGGVLFFLFPHNPPVTDHGTQGSVTPGKSSAKPAVPPSNRLALPALTVAPPQEENPPIHRLVQTADKDLPPDFLDRIVSGNTASFTLPDGRQAIGSVDMIQHDAQGILFVQGRLTAPNPGFYFFQRQTVPGVAGPLVGNIRFDDKDDAWKVEPAGPLGAPRLVARKIDEIICANYDQIPELIESDINPVVGNAPQTHPTDIPIPSYQTIIPLQSLPGAIGVIYLDFDGETGPFPGWGDFNAAPANANNTQIFDVWRMVCEDFQGFNVNVTTDRKVFDNAPEGRRQHVIITPTTSAAPGAGGVAYVGSYNWSGDRPCWAFYSVGKSSCEVISHEVGHTLGLSHDGRTSPAEGYYGGHGSGSTGWAPIMGVGYYQTLTQWSKGEYLNANQTQDDLAIIVNNNNDVDYRVDDMGETLSTASYLEIAPDNSVTNEGIIETTGDIDSFRFVTTGGQATIYVNTVTLNPDLDILAEILNTTTSAVVASDNPDLGINAVVSANLSAGEYLLRVRGVGRGDPLGNGYTNYASMGSYLITGSVSGGLKPDRFTIVENSANGAVVGTLAPRNNHGANPLSYTITSGNTSGAFAINATTGKITVANSSAIDYETLSLRWDDPATIELFVNIADTVNPVLNESLRAVVTVTNVNESPSVTGGSATILEHTVSGTKVLKVIASDPDRFDFPTFAITAGNTGNAFAINSGTGQLTVEADIDILSETIFNLTVTITDQGSPALTSSVVVPITVVDITAGYNPGGIVRTYFENISGNTVANLTSNANFPIKPDSEQFLTSFDGLAHGDNFGSTIRGYLIPPVTGTYQFWIASDDASELQLSTNYRPTRTSVIASVTSYTSQYAWTTYASQQSVTRTLTAGQPYYIEARHKEGGGGDHVAVAWTGPGINRQVIPGLYLAPYYQNYAPAIHTATYTIRENAVPGQPVGIVTSTDINSQDTFTYVITGGNTGGVFAINAATGQLSVAQSGLLNASTTPAYTLTIQSTDNGTPALIGSGTVTVSVLAATGINVAGIVREIWTGLSSSTAISSLTSSPNYPSKPNDRRILTDFDSGTGYGDNYGSRIRVKFIPPSSGNYQFHISGDDESRLLFSSVESGSGAAQIASVSGWSDHNVWNKYTSQASAVKSLVAGQAVYLETLHKEGGGGDHVSVGFTGPDTPSITVIPGSLLLPFNINAAPSFSPASYDYSLNAATATAGMSLGTLSATDPNGEPLIYAILSGNLQSAFVIDPASGDLSLSNPNALDNGDVNLLVIAQDGGLDGAYPLASATSSVLIHVSGVNHAPGFLTNPILKPDAVESAGYAQSLAGSASDPDPGDALTFSILGGPTWLNLAPDGSLSGTPGSSNIGTNTFTVRVTDTGSLHEDAILKIEVISTNPDANGNGILDGWEIEKFGNANPGNNPATADADSDGLPNLLEFALGTDPLHRNPNPLTAEVITGSGGDDFLQLTVAKNPTATNLTYTVETCGTLSDWSSANTVIETESTTELIVRDTIGGATAPQRFIRLRVTVVP